MDRSQRGSSWERAAVFVALVGLTYLLLRIVWVGAQLGYDESVYALGGQSLVTGKSTTQFPIYRPIGMQVVAAPGVLLGGSEVWLRVPALLASAGCLFAFWLAARRCVGTAATWTLPALATSVELQRRSSELLSDLPSLAFIFTLLWVLLRELQRPEGPRRSLLVAAPLAAGAFYLRYGATMILGVIALTVLLLWRRRWISSWRWLLATAALFLAMLLPHFVQSTLATGSPLGILRVARKVAGRTELGEGLLYYVNNFPEQPGGTWLAILIVGGLISGGVHLFRLWRARDDRDRLISCLFLIACAHTLLVGIDVHGESRYVFLGMMLLAVLGMHGLMSATKRLGDRLPQDWKPRASWVAAVGLALLLSSVALSANQQAVRDARSRKRGGRTMIQTAQVLKGHGLDRCAVVTSQPPQLSWYSGCDGYAFTRRPNDVITRIRQQDYPVGFMVMFSRGKREPEGKVLDQILAQMEQPPLAVIDETRSPLGAARVYRIREARNSIQQPLVPLPRTDNLNEQ